jgi:hypothetical protein
LKNEIGQIELRGACRSGTTTGNTTLFTLPLSLLPVGRQFTLNTFGKDAGGAMVNVGIWVNANTREVKLYGTGTTTINFDGIVLTF